VDLIKTAFNWGNHKLIEGEMELVLGEAIWAIE